MTGADEAGGARRSCRLEAVVMSHPAPGDDAGDRDHRARRPRGRAGRRRTALDPDDRLIVDAARPRRRAARLPPPAGPGRARQPARAARHRRHLDRSSSCSTTGSSRPRTSPTSCCRSRRWARSRSGIVLVLLLGEIDLSVGSVSGFAAAVMAVLNVKHGWPRRRRRSPPRSSSGVAHRCLPGRVDHEAPGAVVRRDPRRLAGVAGRAALRARRHGHDQPHRPTASSA